MDRHAYPEYRELTSAGWSVSKTNNASFNGGSSETYQHWMGKCAAAYVGVENGYRVDSETEHQERGEIDILLYGNPERITLAVEIETDPENDVVQDKLERYVYNTPIQDMILIDVDEIPTEMHRAKHYVAGELGLDHE